MNEIIKGMRVIKMYAWENHFSKIISSIRKYKNFFHFFFFFANLTLFFIIFQDLKLLKLDLPVI